MTIWCSMSWLDDDVIYTSDQGSTEWWNQGNGFRGNWEAERKWEEIRRARGRKREEEWKRGILPLPISLIALSGPSNPLSEFYISLPHMNIFAFALPLPAPPYPTDLLLPRPKKRLPRPFLLNDLQLCTNTLTLGCKKRLKLVLSKRLKTDLWRKRSWP